MGGPESQDWREIIPIRPRPALPFARSWRRSIAVVIRLERAVGRDDDIGRLFFRELRQLDTDLVEVQARDLFVEVLGQGVDLFMILGRIGHMLTLSNRLI